MTIDVGKIIQYEYPGRLFTCADNTDYGTLVFLDDAEIPSREEFEGKWAGVQAKIEADREEQARIAELTELGNQLWKFFEANLTADQLLQFAEPFSLVKAFLERGNKAVPRLIIQNTEVPPELEELKSQILGMIPE